VRLAVAAETFPIAGKFTIARGAKTEAHVLVVTLEKDGFSGRGEAVPYARYGESMDGCVEALKALAPSIDDTLTLAQIQALLPAGAARNALDCAFWDLEAKRTGIAVVQRLKITLKPLTTAYTLSLDTPDAMAAQARINAHRPLLKLKIGAKDDLTRIGAVHRAAPNAALIVDANEGLRFDDFAHMAPDLKRLKVALVEQPLSVAEDEALEGFNSPVPLCADESLHTRAELTRCARLYGYVNIKLDKTGGLSEAMALKAEAEALGLGIMVGCMVATSLSMAPAMLVAQGATFVDLDGPLLLAHDREHGLKIDGSTLYPPSPQLWG
jgi:L-alanine-DL-glutamate epimerase-like enolase superfamily enzyme